MNQEQFQIIRDTVFNECKAVNAKKCHDYATADVLSNFKRIALVAKTLDIDVKTPQGYALFMAMMKIDRINNLIKSNTEVKCEPIDDSFIDCINYLILAYALIKEDR